MAPSRRGAQLRAAVASAHAASRRAADASQQAMIIMDDVVANGGRFLNAFTPSSLDIARDSLGQLARLHAATWGCEDIVDLDWLDAGTPALVDLVSLDQLQSLLADGRACWLDWQVVQRGNWATDISYHLATVLDIETRRAHEAELLHHSLAELDTLGAPAPAWDEAWEQYTLSFSYAYFLWVITRISSRRVVLIHIPRLAAALTDHDTFRRLGVV